MPDEMHEGKMCGHGTQFLEKDMTERPIVTPETDIAILPKTMPTSVVVKEVSETFPSFTCCLA